MTETKCTPRYEITKPDGNVEQINDIVGYCETNSLNAVGLTMVLNNFADTYRGYTISKL